MPTPHTPTDKGATDEPKAYRYRRERSHTSGVPCLPTRGLGGSARFSEDDSGSKAERNPHAWRAPNADDAQPTAVVAVPKHNPSRRHVEKSPKTSLEHVSARVGPSSALSALLKWRRPSNVTHPLTGESEQTFVEARYTNSWLEPRVW